MATILELAEFSDLVYEPNSTTATAKKLIAALNIGDPNATPKPTWSLLMTSSDPSNPDFAKSKSDGYYAAAYINNNTGEIVIANRGTNPLSPADLLSDIKLATGQKSPAQDDAVAFAQLIANDLRWSGHPIIETGHSLGGSEAQAATAALVDAKNTASAVTFNAPGIAANTVLLYSAASYQVLNLYDQGDAIHLAGGVHLGNYGTNGTNGMVMLPTGPNTSSLAWGTPAALAAGPVGVGALLLTALYKVLGPAHSLETIITYLGDNTTALGSLVWSATGVASLPPLGGTGSSTGPTISVDTTGALVLTMSPGNYVTITASPDKKSINATFTGSGSAIFQQLAAMGTVSIPAPELNQVITGLTSATTINETITRNSSNTLDVAFQNAGSTNSGDQFKVSVTNPASVFNYVVPTNGQTVVETIDNGSNTSGTVSVITGTGTTQLTGGAPVAGSGNTWVDGSGDQYQFTAASIGSNIGTMTISQGLLIGADKIAIQNFDMNAAQNGGDLGIKFGGQLAIVAGDSPTSPFVSGAPINQTADVPTGTSKTVTIYGPAGNVQLACSGSYDCVTGADTLSFANGPVTLTIPTGQNSVTFTLVDTSNSNQADTANLTASQVDASGNTINSNALAVKFDNPNPNAGGNTIVGTPSTATINGIQVPITVFTGDGANDQIITGSGINSVTGGNGNDVIVGNGGQDVLISGNGNNKIYANTQTDLATALTQRDAATATGQQGDLIAVGDGNNTIVGGNGNDVIFTGTGNNTIVCGPGSAVVAGGVEVSSAAMDWTGGPVAAQGYGIGYQYSDINGVSAPFNAPSSYNGCTFGTPGSALLPVGVGNDTIYGGAGNSYYYLSNGNNWLDAGGGNDYIHAGIGNSTIFGGIGNDTIKGGGGGNYINLESGNDMVILQGGNQTVIGGSGNDTIISGDYTSSWATSETSANNLIEGGSGNNTILGSGGNDTLISGSLSGTGQSTLIQAGNGNEYIVGGYGSDTIYGGAGNDTIYAGGGSTGIQLSASASESSIVYGGTGSDTIIGGAGTDVINAGDGGTASAATQVYAGSGSSTITGGAGVDQLFGGYGSDTLIAGTGTSTLQGGTGTEVMYSGIGNDTLIAGTGNDTLYGGGGTDVLQGSSGNTLFVAGSGNETIIGGSGKNTYLFNPGFGNVELQNSTTADTFEFGTGITLADLTFSATIGSNGSNALLVTSDTGGSLTLDGGLNGSIGNYVFLDPTTMNLNQMLAQGNSVSATVAGVNGNLIFSASGNDTLIGGSGSDTIYGWNSGNTITAGTGDQTLYSESGYDLVTGGAGNDTLISAAGNDTLVGGTGNTTFVVNSTTDLIQAQSTGNTNTVMSSVSYAAPTNVQNLVGTGSAEITLTGNDLNNYIAANSGNDTLVAGTGIALMVGGTGNDTFVVNNAYDFIQAQSTGSNINTVLTSVNYVTPYNVQNITGTGSAAITLTGNNLNNVITANTGNDTLIAGTGNDTLVGGAQNGVGQSVTYQLNAGIGNVTIIDSLATDTFAFGAGINASEITANYVAASGGTLNLNLQITGGGSVDINGVTPNSLYTANYADGSYSTFTADALGNSLVQNYAVNGTLASDSWTKANGTSGSDSYFTGGASIQKVINSDGSSTIVSSDNLGDSSTTLYNASGVALSDTWISATGTHGSDTFNADGSKLGTSINADGSYSSYTQDLSGNTTTNVYNTSGTLTEIDQNNADGSSQITTYNADGSYVIETNDGVGDTVTQNYNTSKTLLSDTWQNQNGTRGSDTYNADGSVISLYYNSNGSYHQTTKDASGNATTNYYTSAGILDATISTNANGTTNTSGQFNNANFLTDGAYSTTSIINGQPVITFYNGNNAVTGSTNVTMPVIGSGGYAGSYSNDNYISLTTNLANGTTANANIGLFIENGVGIMGVSAIESITNSAAGTAIFYGGAAGQNYLGNGGKGVLATPLGGTPLPPNSQASLLGNLVSIQYLSSNGTSFTPSYNSSTPPQTVLVPIQWLPTNPGTTNLSGGGTSLYGSFGQNLSYAPLNGGFEIYKTEIIAGSSSSGGTPYPANYSAVITYANGTETTTFANNALVQDTIVQNDGQYLITRYDSKGNIISTSSSDGFSSTSTANGYGKIYYNNSLVSAQNGTANTVYDASGQSISTPELLSQTGMLSSAPAISIQTNDVQGNATNYNYANDTLTTTWANADGSMGTGTFNLANGTGFETIKYLDGTWSTSINDGKGDFTVANYNANGIHASDSWGHADGSHGSDIFNADGSSSGIAYNADNSYSNYTNDGHGDIVTTNFDASGNELGYSTAINNGQGTVTTTNFDASGNELGYSIAVNNGQGVLTTTNYGANGSLLGSSITTNDGLGDTTTINYDANGNKLSDSWTLANGSYGNDTYNTNGSSSGISYNPDGSYSSYTNDGLGDTTTTNFDPYGNKLNDSWTLANGSYGNDTFNSNGYSSGVSFSQNGSYSVYTNDGYGDVTTQYYDANNNYLGSSYSTNDRLGDTSTTNYDANGNTTSYSWTLANGAHGIDIYNANGSVSATSYNPDNTYSIYTNDGLGDNSTTNYDASGNKLNDSWFNANGSYGNDTFNADGSSSGTSYNQNGSYSSYINDGHGDITTTNYDASGNEFGYSIAVNNGQGNITTTNYGVNGNVLGSSVVTNDGQGDTSTTNYEANGSYQQSTVSSNGSTTTTDYNAVTGEVTGSVATVGAGYSYTYDNTQNVGGVAGVTESVVDYTYANGTTYATNTVSDANGSYQQSTVNGNGSTTTTDYNAVTGEVTGSVATVGAGYSYTYDNTKNVGGVAGVTESVVDYTYSNGTTYATDTVSDANGSYQQSTVNGNGSTTTTDYNAVTGEVTGSVATVGAGYSYTYDNTINVGGVVGVTESVVDYTYANGTTYATNTVSDANGSYQQSTVSGNGSTTTTDYNAVTGEVIGSVVTVGSGYSYTYDNTQNVGGVVGVTESVVDYTYANGTTYSTNTVSDANGSYQQSTVSGNGSTTTTDYNAVTGEVTGSVATAGAGYSYTYDNTQNVGGVAGVTESVVNYTYANGTTYATDTISDANGSYQQSTVSGRGSTTTTDYNAVTGEVIGSVATVGAGYSYTYDNTVNVGGVSGVTESKVGYTYSNGTIYATDTISDANGSYQQSTVNGNGSTTTTDYNAVTGEVTGSVATAGAGYSYTYDNTQNVGGVAGVTESKVDYTYSNGTTYNTDTVSDANGSYQQSTISGNGSTTTTNYNAVTGEVIGSVATVGSGYSYTYDNTVNVGGVSGVTESVVNYTYTNGSTYSTDTVSNPDGSYFQSWSNSNGTAGSSAVNASGTLIGDSVVNVDGSQEVDAAGNSLIMGSSANNNVVGTSGNDILIGPTGNAAITTGSGTNVIAFNAGDGQEVVNDALGQNNTISLGGNFAYSDLALQKSGNNLVLDIGASNSITFQNWYAGSQNIVNLQVIASAMSDFSPGSTNVLSNSNVEEFNFQTMVSEFNQALVTNPSLTSWGVTNALLDAHLSGSNSSALGGDLAYVYGTNGNLTGFGVSAAQGELSNSQFASAPQALNPWPTLNTGTAHIR